MPKQRRKIGDLGEHSFTVWCSQLGMDAVKAVPDRNGWDYLVEFERCERTGLPPDAQHNLVKSYFQIKSTEKSNSSMLGKLSAFKALVSADAPAFVVKFEFGKESLPTRCRLLHIGEPQIAAVLKRVREAHRDEAELHKINFSLPLDGARTVEFGSEEFRDYIEECVGASPASYVIEKEKIRKSVGYGNDAFKFSFNIKKEDDEKFVDFLIGKIPDISISTFGMKESRFGIELPSHDGSLRDGVLKIDKLPFKDVEIVSSSSASGIECSVKGKLYFPLVPNLPREMIKFRILNHFLEIDISSKSNDLKLRVNIPPQEKMSIYDLSDALKFMSAMSFDDCNIEIRFDGGLFAGGGKLSFKGSLIPFRGLSAFADEICRAFSGSMREAPKFVSLAELEEVYRSNSEGRGYLDDGGKITARAQLQENIPDLPDGGIILVPLCFDFDEFSYIGIARSDIIEIDIDEENNMTAKSISNRVIERKILLHSDGNYKKANERAAQIARSGDGDGKLVIWPTLVPAGEE